MVYCFYCKLFDAAESQFITGYCDRKHSNERIRSHESSASHMQNDVQFNILSKEVGRIDNDLARQMKYSVEYWRAVLRRVISVVKFLCKRGLGFRGDDEIIGSDTNRIFLGLIELLSEYDTFLAEHLKNHGNCGSGHTNYLSSTIYEVVIDIMGLKVKEELLKRLEKSKFYSISVDSTTDEAHFNQLCIIFRYLEGSEPVERFLEYLPNQGHSAIEILDGILQVLAKYNINLDFCRSQSFDQ